MKGKIVLVIVALLAVGGGSFYGGMVYGRNQASQQVARRRFDQLGGNLNNPNRQNGGVASGEVLSVTDKMMTVKLRDGGSKNILLSGSTQVRTFNEVPVSELQAGKFVSVTGNPNADGSITAQSIQLLAGSSTPYRAMPQGNTAPQNNQ